MRIKIKLMYFSRLRGRSYYFDTTINARQCSRRSNRNGIFMVIVQRAEQIFFHLVSEILIHFTLLIVISLGYRKIFTGPVN